MADWSVTEKYVGADGLPHESPPETVAAIRELLGDEDLPGNVKPVVVERGMALPDGALEILTEDGSTIAAPSTADETVPLGYHRLRLRRGGDVAFIVSPGVCWYPENLRGWGWAVQLYADRSRQSWGMGDIGDLSTITRWSARQGALYTLVNPLHAPSVTPDQDPSPYYPSSRRWRNPLYIRVEDIPGADECAAGIEPLAKQGHALNDERMIDRAAVYRIKMQAFEYIWKHVGVVPASAASFDAYVAREGEDLRRYGAFCTLSEELGAGWWSWPAEYQTPGAKAVEAFAYEHSDRVHFHMWLQFLIDFQLEAASNGVVVMHDLAIGCDGGGADSWLYPGVFTRGYDIGAPPDVYNTQGQNWGLPPFHPRELQLANYAPFIQLLRAAFRSGGAIRFDHVMGLFRLWWIPQNAEPTQGAYVRYPAADLLNILALESQRAKGLVVGEDMGTVEPEVHAELQRRHMLGYRLMLFGGEFPVETMTALTCQDSPTLVGTWTGSDVAEQTRLDLKPNVEGDRESRELISKMVGKSNEPSSEDVVTAAYEYMAQHASSRLLAASLEDAACVAERPNMPGTINQWPNWRWALPRPVEDVLADPVAESIARSLRRRH